jgi:phospholipid-binding lipoprotein MlaA
MELRPPVPLFALVFAFAAALTITRPVGAQTERAASSVPSDYAGPVGAAASIAEEPASQPADDDPFEPFNRAMFAFNDGFDHYLLRPAAAGWDFVVPVPVENAFGRFFENLRFPIRFANNLLQGKVDPAAITLCRFLVNSTFGVAGFLDVGTGLGLPRQDGDFGQTLGIWGFPGGPYLVWPIFGPSNPRDTVGLVGDTYLNVGGLFIDFYVLLGARVVETVNARSLALGDVDRAREASLDFYTAVRTAYLARRNALIAGTKTPTKKEELDLYFPDYSDESVLP